ncbi:MAG: hypothetical protein ACR2JE_11450 [Acidobacteriaceae bacterium]
MAGSYSWEQEGIDLHFRLGSIEVLAELKVAYGGNTRHAIREALGQILEYNHYPRRQGHDHWLLVLDSEPQRDDRVFVERLREKRKLPLTLGWKTQDGFTFHPHWPC